MQEYGLVEQFLPISPPLGMYKALCKALHLLISISGFNAEHNYWSKVSLIAVD